MQLSTIEMDRTEARKRFLEYRQAVRDRHDQEDEAIMRGYRELAKGRQLIRLSDTIRQGGLNDQQLPNLAVAQADTQRVWLSVSPRGRVIQFLPERDVAHNRRKGVWQFGDLWGSPVGNDRWWDTWYAMVPNVPPALRPAHHLRNYAILFEAEWRKEPTPPKDPALIKRVGGDLYAVLAVWDLTEIERAVLFGTRK